MPSLFISDGFTLQHTVEGRDGLPPLTVHYRPAVRARVLRWRREIDAARGAQERAKSTEERLKADGDLEAADVRLLADQLINWDAGVPLDEDHIRRLWPQVTEALLNVVTGYVVGQKFEAAEKNSSTG